MQQRLMKKTAVCALVFFLVSMGFILAISAGREGEPIEEMEEPAFNEAMENELFAMCFATEDQKEGMGAFLEKRKEKHFQNK